jgi:hypothetical protein
LLIFRRRQKAVQYEEVNFTDNANAGVNPLYEAEGAVHENPMFESWYDQNAASARV